MGLYALVHGMWRSGKELVLTIWEKHHAIIAIF